MQWISYVSKQIAPVWENSSLLKWKKSLKCSLLEMFEQKHQQWISIWRFLSLPSNQKEMKTEYTKYWHFIFIQLTSNIEFTKLFS